MNDAIRNIAIIAHVDHGKTTLVDAMLRQSGIFRINHEVSERVLDSHELQRLFMDREAVEHHHDFPVLYTKRRPGGAHRKRGQSGGDDAGDLTFLFEAILNSHPGPAGDPQKTLQVQVTNLDYSGYLGRIAIARVFEGTLRRGDQVGIVKLDRSLQTTSITKLFTFRGLERDGAETVSAGDIVAIAGG